MVNTNQEKNKTKSILSTCYSIYHFVAKVFLYSILIILILVAIGVTAYFGDMLYNVNTGKNKMPLLGAYIIITPSMDPTIKVEDAIIIMRKEPEEFKKRDIITFMSSDPRYSGLIITHRIVGIEKMKNGEIYFRTKGDNNNVEDASLVPAKNVYGKVILKIPKIGYIQYILLQSYGWIILVVLPCLGIVIYDIIKLVKSINKNKPQKPKDNNKNQFRKKQNLDFGIKSIEPPKENIIYNNNHNKSIPEAEAKIEEDSEII